jgi:anti-anti-sigma factor
MRPVGRVRVVPSVTMSPSTSSSDEPTATVPAPIAQRLQPSASSEQAATLRLLRFDEARTHIALSGALDIAGTRRIEQSFTAMVTARRLSTIIELPRVHFLSSYAMCMLVLASRAIRLRGRLLVLVGPTPDIDRILRATRLHQLMPIVATCEEAERLIAAHEAKSA